MSDLAARIRSARETKGLKPGDLARLADLSHSGINLIEAGTRRHLQVETLVKLSRALGVSLEWLATGEERVSGPHLPDSDASEPRVPLAIREKRSA